jgi:ATP-dependent helicase HrpB
MPNLTHLPIDDVVPDIVDALTTNNSLVLQAPAGAGKTTRVPPAVLDARLAVDGRILVLEPRRVAARATAKRIAYERGVSLGDEVGYQVRFDRRMSDKTRLAIITEGILTRRLQSDPFLEGVGAVILDEFHERSIHTDLAVAFLRELQQVRDDLKVVVMSATITTGPIADYLDCPIIESEGRTFPVDIEYLDKPSDDPIETQATRAVSRILGQPEDDGDILVFMPGAGSIHRTIETVKPVATSHHVEILPLYGALPPQQQDRAIESGGARKIIVSTNIAETSLTIEGVTSVVDSGLVKQLRMSPQSGLDKLEKTHISLASADQRAGRAGRVRPGRAFRLWTNAFEFRMPDEDTPEIQRVDITAPILEVIAWSGADPKEFGWFEAPPDHAIDRAVELLRDLGAVDPGEFRLTDTGTEMLELPAHPRLGRMLIEGSRRGCLRTTAGMAAVLSERDFVGRVDQGAPSGDSDLLRRAELLDEVAHGSTGAARRLGLHANVGRAKRVKQVRDQLERASSGQQSGQRPAQATTTDALKALAVGYPDRICISRGEGRKYVMVGGEPLALAYESVVRDAEFIVAATIGGETRARNIGAVSSRGLIRLASRVERAWLEELFPGQFETKIEVNFDDQRKRVMAVERELFHGLNLSEAVVSVDAHADPAEVTRMLARAAAEDLGEAFSLSKDGEQFLDRLRCLREWMPELELPNLDADSLDTETENSRLREMLGQICWGHRSFADLKRVDLVGALKGYLDHDQISALAEFAPPALTVPSGKSRRLKYEPGKPPVLEVRIQEMFGTARTPTVARGKIPVLLHLLAPNYRPQQVTDDLAGFWENTYPEVRKELRARYSKHPWPEDPLSAKAVAK